VPLETRELSSTTWSDFVRIMEKHDGVWGGCWCVEFHLQRGDKKDMGVSRRALKEKLVRANRSHAALVYDGDDVVGWCQFGPPAELPARMSGFAKLGEKAPDWRITCFFVDRDHRKQGVSTEALKGALRMIAAGGGGTVDGYPTSTSGKPYSSSFLWAGTESLFAAAGFRPLGALGKTKSVMRKVVRARR
jgi:GNAT superfamily N-acetyltransferase